MIFKIKIWFLSRDIIRNIRQWYYKQFKFKKLEKERKLQIQMELKDKITSATYQFPPC